MEKGDIQTKISILNNLGSNWTMEGKKVFFEPNKFLEPVKKDYKKLEEEFLRLEPNKVDEKKYSLAIERIRLQWHAIVFEVRTVVVYPTP